MTTILNTNNVYSGIFDTAIHSGLIKTKEDARRLIYLAREEFLICNREESWVIEIGLPDYGLRTHEAASFDEALRDASSGMSQEDSASIVDTLDWLENGMGDRSKSRPSENAILYCVDLDLVQLEGGYYKVTNFGKLFLGK